MKKTYILILLLTIFLMMFLLYNKLSFMDVLVRFDDVEPFERQMPVYFKGFKIGKTTKIFPDENYQNTYLKLRLKKSKMEFPSNISVNIKMKKSGGYVNVLYPDEPTLKKLKENDVIRGVITKDIKDLLESKITSEDVEGLIDGVSSVIDSANVTLQNLSDIFIEVREIISASRTDIKSATSNLSKASKNLSDMSEKVNNSIQAESISNSINNIELVTDNLQEITTQIDSISVPIINNTLCEVNSTIKNVKDISCGIKNTLKKHFGLGKLLFGKPIRED